MNLNLYSDVGVFPIDVNTISNSISGLKEGEDLTININSMGGSLTEGIAIYNILKACPNKKIVNIQGICASSASLIAMAGDVINIAKNAFIMIHNPEITTSGNAEDLQKDIELLDKMKTSMLSIYMSKSNLTGDRLSEMLNAETWLNAQESLDFAFVSSITDSIDLSAKTSKLSIPVNVKNSLNIFDKKDLDSLNNKLECITLQLVEKEKAIEELTNSISSKDESILTLKTTLEEIANQSKSEIDKLKSSIESKDLALNEKQSKYDTVKNSLNKLEQEYNQLLAKHSKLTITGVSFTPSKVVDSWKDALKACDGDYVVARKTYPQVFDSFMMKNGK